MGRVRHRRTSPVENAFQYSGFWMYLDLAEVDRVFADRWLWSTTRLALARFRREDHLVFPDDFMGEGLQGPAFTPVRELSQNSRAADEPTDSSSSKPTSQPGTRVSFGRRPLPRNGPLPPLDESVRQLVETATGSRPAGPIRLLTQLRFFGYVLNPVSFYYCFDASGANLEVVVADVNNTPWGERHCYVLNGADAVRSDVASSDRSEVDGDRTRRHLRFEHDKRFHVSPFMDLEMEYRWNITVPHETLSVHIENWRDDGPLFDATLELSRRPITGLELAGALCRHPFMTGKMAVAIYWQALKLWWKRCPFVPHPNARAK